jgi:hypothetical protein
MSQEIKEQQNKEYDKQHSNKLRDLEIRKAMAEGDEKKAV